MGQGYLLTGEAQVGKTTALKKVIQAIGLEHCGGFYTEEIRAPGKDRTGFRLVTLDGQAGILASVEFESPIRVAKYGINLESLESIGVAAICTALQTKPFVVIDEIGPMQLFSDAFKQAVINVLGSPRTLIGTIVLRAYPWVDELKQQNRLQIYKLTPYNREDIVERLVLLLKSEQRTNHGIDI